MTNLLHKMGMMKISVKITRKLWTLRVNRRVGVYQKILVGLAIGQMGAQQL